MTKQQYQRCKDNLSDGTRVYPLGLDGMLQTTETFGSDLYVARVSKLHTILGLRPSFLRDEEIFNSILYGVVEMEKYQDCRLTKRLPLWGKLREYRITAGTHRDIEWGGFIHCPIIMMNESLSIPEWVGGGYKKELDEEASKSGITLPQDILSKLLRPIEDRIREIYGQMKKDLPMETSRERIRATERALLHDMVYEGRGNCYHQGCEHPKRQK